MHKAIVFTRVMNAPSVWKRKIVARFQLQKRARTSTFKIRLNWGGKREGMLQCERMRNRYNNANDVIAQTNWANPREQHYERQAAKEIGWGKPFTQMLQCSVKHYSRQKHGIGDTSKTTFEERKTDMVTCMNATVSAHVRHRTAPLSERALMQHPATTVLVGLT